MGRKQPTWLALAIEEEDRLGMTPLESYEYQDDSDGMTIEELTYFVGELQVDLLGEVIAIKPSQRRSYLSSIFAYMFQWGQD